MTRIAGIQFKDNEKGMHTHITIDLKKHGEKLQPFLKEIGAIEEEDNFEREWKKGYTVEEARKKTHEFVRSLPWKK